MIPNGTCTAESVSYISVAFCSRSSHSAVFFLRDFVFFLIVGSWCMRYLAKSQKLNTNHKTNLVTNVINDSIANIGVVLSHIKILNIPTKSIIHRIINITPTNPWYGMSLSSCSLESGAFSIKRLALASIPPIISANIEMNDRIIIYIWSEGKVCHLLHT